MTWWFVVPTVAVALWLAGVIYRLFRAPLDGQESIRYHWHSRLARIAAMLRGSKSNYAVTLGRHTFVRLGYIRREHASHEFRHAQQADRWGGFAFLVRALYEYARYGYKDSPIETDARAFAEAHGHEFKEIQA